MAPDYFEDIFCMPSPQVGLFFVKKVILHHWPKSVVHDLGCEPPLISWDAVYKTPVHARRCEKWGVTKSIRNTMITLITDATSISFSAGDREDPGIAAIFKDVIASLKPFFVVKA